MKERGFFLGGRSQDCTLGSTPGSAQALVLGPSPGVAQGRAQGGPTDAPGPSSSGTGAETPRRHIFLQNHNEVAITRGSLPRRGANSRRCRGRHRRQHRALHSIITQILTLFSPHTRWQHTPIRARTLRDWTLIVGAVAPYRRHPRRAVGRPPPPAG